MAIYTCSCCGEYVQKPKVERHETRYRDNPPNLCCMDCLKNFGGDEFKIQRKYFSAAEKHDRKGLVAISKYREKSNDYLSDETTENVKLVVKSLSKKDKKEKKKRDKYQARLKEAAHTPNNNAIEEDDEEMKKKSKKRKVTEESVESNGVSVEKNSNVSEVRNKSGPSAFDWANTILTVLESIGTDVTLKKLQKTILAEYCIVNGVSEIPERITKKFPKALYKIPNVKIINDKVRLVKEEE